MLLGMKVPFLTVVKAASYKVQVIQDFLRRITRTRGHFTIVLR